MTGSQTQYLVIFIMAPTLSIMKDISLNASSRISKQSWLILFQVIFVYFSVAVIAAISEGLTRPISDIPV
jgi:hypothetical protein